MFEKLRARIAKAIAPAEPKHELPLRHFGDEPVNRQNAESVKLRRWDSADTNRLNAEQWQNIESQSINADMEEQLPTLIARCRHERKNNPMVEGVISSFSKFVCGRGGPSLIVQSDNDDYNLALTQVWNEYWARPTVDGVSGIALLKRLIGQSFDAGCWLQQKIDYTRELPSSAPVKTRLLDIDPLRMWTPPGTVHNRNIVAGVERNGFGMPRAYHVRNPKDQNINPMYDWSLNYLAIPADEILHTFVSTEPGQATGVPLLASVLQETADLRDLDVQVLDAMRVAANNGMLLETLVPELVADHAKVFSGRITLERQVAKAVPVGYTAKGQVSSQPGAQYIEFRHEKLRSLGRVVNMPLLMVLLSAEESNFSQSKIDLNVLFQNTVTDEQQRIETDWLNHQVAMVAIEAGLAFAEGMTSHDADPFLMPRKPRDVHISWGWEPIAQTQELDHVKTQGEKIKLGLLAPAMELAAEGKQEDRILQSIAATNKKRKAHGLEPLPGPDQPKQAIDETQQKQTSGTGSAAKPTGGKKSRSNSRLVAR